ncbi:MAG: hypothetical protein KAW12_12110 [Candidatus Aminicenantes bacterium]|nr:hypothetical protein [Candidatus Aminicenantes bacterium]
MKTKKRIETIFLKAFIVLFVLVGFGTLLPAQNAYYDALYLSDHKDEIKEFAELLEYFKAHYAKHKDHRIFDPENFTEIYKVNDFLLDPWVYRDKSLNVTKLRNELEVLISKKVELGNCKNDCIRAEKVNSQSKKSVIINFFDSIIRRKIDVTAFQRLPIETQESYKYEELKQKYVKLSDLDKMSTAATAPAIPVSSGTGINLVSKVADGMAKFLVERVKQELSAAFFIKFKDEIKKKDYKILQELFPETYNVLKTIDKEIYKFSSYINVLREAFEKDLSSALSNFQNTLKKGTFDKFIKDSKLKDIVKTALRITDRFKKGDHPVDILLEEETLQLLVDNNTIIESDLKNLLKALKIVSDSIRDKSGERYWLDWKSLKLLFEQDENNEHETFRIYLGLIWQKSAGIVIGGENFRDSLENLDKIAGEFKKLKTIVNDYVFKIDLLETYKAEIRKKKENGEKPTYKNYYNFYSEALDAIEYSIKLAQHILKDKNLPDEVDTIILDDKIKKYLDFAGILSDIYLDANQRNYSSVIFNILHIFDKIFLPLNDENFKKGLKATINEKKKKLENETDDQKKEVIRETIKQLEKKIEKWENLRKIKAKILKYGAFMAAVAKAENSDQVKEAIESVALPAGSYSIKRNAKWNISLNAYVGINLGDEDLSGKFTLKKSVKLNSLGIWAPVGVAISKGHKGSFLGIQSISIFLSAIDIGAVTAYRFKEEDAQDMPEFHLKNILAPGAHLVLGFKNSPISIGGGIQFGPQLRKIISTDETTGLELITEASAWRINFFVAVDIPLLNFKTITRL